MISHCPWTIVKDIDQLSTDDHLVRSLGEFAASPAERGQAMATCIECDTANPNDNRHCAQCGAPLPTTGVSVAQVRKLIDDTIAKKSLPETEALEAKVFEGARKKITEYIKIITVPLALVVSVAAGFGISKVNDIYSFMTDMKKQLEISQRSLLDSFNSLQESLITHNIQIVNPATRTLLEDYFSSYLGFLKDLDPYISDKVSQWSIKVTDHLSYAENEMVTPWKMSWRINVAAGAIGNPALALTTITNFIMEPPGSNPLSEPRQTGFEPQMLLLSNALPIYIVCAFRNQSIWPDERLEVLPCSIKIDEQRLVSNKLSKNSLVSDAVSSPPSVFTNVDEFLTLFTDIEKIDNMGRRRTAALLLRTWFIILPNQSETNNTNQKPTAREFLKNMPNEFNKMWQQQSSSRPTLKDFNRTLSELNKILKEKQ